MMDVKLRFAHVELLAEQYERFEDFAFDGMAFLGFPLTYMQRDISEYMQDGPRLRMVMAQRGKLLEEQLHGLIGATFVELLFNIRRT